MQNAAASFLTGTGRRQNITPVSFKLHCLPVHFQIQFKVLLFVFKSLSALAPSSPSCSVHSFPSKLSDPLIITFSGECSFLLCASKLWNHLALSIRLPPSLTSFKTCLKTYFYSLVFHWYDFRFEPGFLLILPSILLAVVLSYSPVCVLFFMTVDLFVVFLFVYSLLVSSHALL